tara:strand:+ start:1441 stop:1728 length:288 start_codon:yes stop_codon:yes gene_type:complete
MAITKEVKQDKIEIVTDNKHLQIREKTIVKEDGVVLSETYTNRYVLDPGTLDASDNLVDRDISGESSEVQAVANAVWTDAVKLSWKNHLIAKKPS